jgi:hypothetical protein
MKVFLPTGKIDSKNFLETYADARKSVPEATQILLNGLMDYCCSIKSNLDEVVSPPSNPLRFYFSVNGDFERSRSTGFFSVSSM